MINFVYWICLLGIFTHKMRASCPTFWTKRSIMRCPKSDFPMFTFPTTFATSKFHGYLLIDNACHHYRPRHPVATANGNGPWYVSHAGIVAFGARPLSAPSAGAFKVDPFFGIAISPPVIDVFDLVAPAVAGRHNNLPIIWQISKESNPDLCVWSAPC